MENHGHTITLPTMDSIARNIRLLLDGKPFEEMYEFCDYSLADQNETSLAKGVQPSAPSDFKPVIKKSVTYIVAAVLINEHGDVLMMQVNNVVDHEYLWNDEAAKIVMVIYELQYLNDGILYVGGEEFLCWAMVFASW